jgi:hypothetical protein
MLFVIIRNVDLPGDDFGFKLVGAVTHGLR